MRCCANGPCSLSRPNGGPGCYLCDVVAKLPQPVFKDHDDGDPESQFVLAEAPKVRAKPERRKAPDRREGKRE